jgi:enterochelin esterase-like enzyme
MKTLAIGILIAIFSCPRVGAQEASPATVSATRPTRVPSPIVEPDHRVTFRLLAPKATEVLLSGEFMKGTKPLEKSDDGMWSVTIGPLEPEIYNYNFTIDGVRTIDPGNPSVKSGSTASTIGSILEVRGDSPAFYDAQPVPHGVVRAHVYQSKSLGTIRRLNVYTPPGYDANSQERLPVLYLLHGANANEDAWCDLGHANLILDNLLAGGKAKPMIVVMPFGYGVTPGSSAGEQGGNTARFGQDLINDVIPLIDSEYRTLADRDHRALVGLSMGGGEALSIGLNHLELFGSVGGFSSGLGRAADFPKTYATLVENPDDSNAKLHLLWIGCGHDDGAFANSKSLSEFLDQHKIIHTFHESSGAHTWMVWRRYLNEVAPLLFR